MIRPGQHWDLMDACADVIEGVRVSSRPRASVMDAVIDVVYGEAKDKTDTEVSDEDFLQVVGMAISIALGVKIANTIRGGNTVKLGDADLTKMVADAAAGLSSGDGAKILRTAASTYAGGAKKRVSYKGVAEKYSAIADKAALATQLKPAWSNVLANLTIDELDNDGKLRGNPGSKKALEDTLKSPEGAAVMKAAAKEVGASAADEDSDLDKMTINQFLNEKFFTSTRGKRFSDKLGKQMLGLTLQELLASEDTSKVLGDSKKFDEAFVNAIVKASASKAEEVLDEVKYALHDLYVDDARLSGKHEITGAQVDAWVEKRGEEFKKAMGIQSDMIKMAQLLAGQMKIDLKKMTRADFEKAAKAAGLSTELTDEDGIAMFLKDDPNFLLDAMPLVKKSYATQAKAVQGLGVGLESMTPWDLLNPKDANEPGYKARAAFKEQIVKKLAAVAPSVDKALDVAIKAALGQGGDQASAGEDVKAEVVANIILQSVLGTVAKYIALAGQTAGTAAAPMEAMELTPAALARAVFGDDLPILAAWGVIDEDVFAEGVGSYVKSLIKKRIGTGSLVKAMSNFDGFARQLLSGQDTATMAAAQTGKVATQFKSVLKRGAGIPEVDDTKVAAQADKAAADTIKEVFKNISAMTAEAITKVGAKKAPGLAAGQKVGAFFQKVGQLKRGAPGPAPVKPAKAGAPTPDAKPGTNTGEAK